MNIRSAISVVALLAMVIGAGILSAALVAWRMGDGEEVVLRLVQCGLMPVAAAMVAFYLFHPQKFELGIREGFAIVTFGWIMAALVGCVPFVLTAGMTWPDAFFETMSGFTTTGASVLDPRLVLRDGSLLSAGIDSLPKGLLYWRSLTHWFGGMGIVVLSLAILPFLGIGGHQLYNAEMPGPTSDRLTPRIANSAKILWGVYVLLSLAETGLLWIGGMSLFESWCHACGTMATGGFSTRNASIGAYASPYFDGIVTLFMFLAGCNFILHFRALRGKPLFHFHDEEFRFYLWLTLGATAIVAFQLLGRPIVDTAGNTHPGTIGNAMRFAAFQVVSMITTTGYCTADFNLWPTASALLLVGLMFVGGCGGSTAGAIKVSRILLLLKYSIERTRRWMFPHAISNVHLNHARVGSDTLHKTLSFFFLFIALFVFFSMAIALLESADVVTATTAAIACLGNIGPGLGKVGAVETYHWMSIPGKLLLATAMLLGRLELYTVLVVIFPSFWKK
jgi:trk system potassium uptake protein TrkH